jgi:hypothetical protein
LLFQLWYNIFLADKVLRTEGKPGMPDTIHDVQHIERPLAHAKAQREKP